MQGGDTQNTKPINTIKTMFNKSLRFGLGKIKNNSFLLSVNSTFSSTMSTMAKISTNRFTKVNNSAKKLPLVAGESLFAYSLFRKKVDLPDLSVHWVQTPRHIEIGEEFADLDNILGNRDGNYDFFNPFSLEFRGVNDLYSMVMLKLLFIFFFLLVLCFYQGAEIGSVYISQWDKVKEIWVKEKRIASFTELYLEVRKSFINYNKKIEEGKNAVPQSNGFVGVSTRVAYAFVKINNIFASSSFWVYYSKLEFVWTFLPCIVLLFISVPSFTLALALDETHKPASWIKVLGNQWFWVYETSTHGENIVIYGNVVYGTDLSDNALRAIEADCVVTLVNNKFNRILVTSADVIHCWAVPSLGIKVDACPGRINTISVMPTKCGVYYGQCSEICGVNHGFMPIVVEVVI